MKYACKIGSMAEKREFDRFIVKLPVTISAGGRTLEGTTVRLSRKGLFARTQQSFAEGVTVEIVITLTNNVPCRLRGVVKYARNCDIVKRQNGMGIEFTQKNEAYEKFISEVEG